MSQNKNLNEKFKFIDQRIKLGQLSAAKVALYEISIKKLPRSHYVEFSEICRRLNLPMNVLKLLNPLIRERALNIPEVTSHESALYAVALAQIGAYSEAAKILKQVNIKEVYQLPLYWLYVLVPQWEYKQCIPHLKKYIRHQHISPYEQLVGRVNLISSYIYVGYFLEAKKHIELARQEALNLNAHLMLKNLRELEVQCALYLGDHAFLKNNMRSTERGGRIKDHYDLFIRKWEAVYRLLQNPSTDKINDLYHIQKQAQQMKHWETCRDIHYQIAKLTHNVDVANIVYMGTRYKAYKKRVKILGHSMNKQICCNLNRLSVGSEDKIVDISDEGLVGRCFSSLKKDIYRPISVGELFQDIYPDEYFNPYSSQQKLYQIVHRLNKELVVNDTGLKVFCRNKQFQLIANQDVSVLLDSKEIKTCRKDVFMQKLKEHFHDDSFSAKQAAMVLNKSRSSIQTLLIEAVGTGKVLQLNRARSCRYIFKPI